MPPPEFPNWFPEGCPPSTAADASGEVFRIVAAEQVTDADFRSHHELGTALAADPCARCGVSLFTSFENALHRQRLSPRLGKFLSKGVLSPQHGKTGIPNVKSGHLEWWAYQNVPRHSCFERAVPCP